ncbi:MAG: hydrogenase iron-sulfur subunit [Pedosphaera sp.]|nr:hydrogenase iron-sulfur subunit [Pedosphaera sp.]
MAPREDGRKFTVQSAVNPDLCVSCGICTGSCDSQAINMPGLNSREVEKRLHVWIDSQKSRSLKPFVAFCCAESSSAVLRADADGSSAELPGYVVQTIPCVGWVSAVILERTLQRGAGGVLVVGCGEGDPVAHEGMKWFEQRMRGRREPRFDPAKADPSRVRFAQFDRTRRAELLKVAREFQQQSTAMPGNMPRRRLLQIAAAIALCMGLITVIFALSNLPYRTPHSSQPELVVSFNHSGAILNARKLTKEELAKRLPHMRAQVNVTRQRTPVRLRVHVNGQIVFDQSFQPKGLSKDGPSIAVVRLPVSLGPHPVRVELADTADPNVWTKQWSETVSFESNRTRVVLFDTKAGFSPH